MKINEKRDLDRMKFLCERMEKRYTADEVMRINEEIDEELDARGRTPVDTSDFFDFISKIKGGVWTTIGYVSVANLRYPTTNRKRDYAKFGQSIGIEGLTGVIKFTSYTLHYGSPRAMTRHYNTKYVPAFNAVYDEYGVSRIQPKEENPITTIDYGNGINAYTGKNVEKQGNTYSPQDTKEEGVKKYSTYYAIGEGGKIIGEVSKETLKEWFKGASIPRKKELVAMNKTDEEIAAYAKKIAAIPHSYNNFEHGSVVYVITSVNGEPKRYFNKNLKNVIGDVPIDTQEILSIAKKRYQVDEEDYDTSDYPGKNNNVEFEEPAAEPAVAGAMNEELDRIVSESVKKALRVHITRNNH